MIGNNGWAQGNRKLLMQCKVDLNQLIVEVC